MFDVQGELRSFSQNRRGNLVEFIAVYDVDLCVDSVVTFGQIAAMLIGSFLIFTPCVGCELYKRYIICKYFGSRGD